MTEARKDPPLAEADPEVFAMIQGEDVRQRDSLRLLLRIGGLHQAYTGKPAFLARKIGP